MQTKSSNQTNETSFKGTMLQKPGLISMWIGFMSSQVIQAHTRVNPNTIPICFKQFVPCHPCQESQVQVVAQCSCIVGFD